MQHLRDGLLAPRQKALPSSLWDGVDSLEGYLHSPWHMYYQLGRHTSHETTDQDRLVLDIVLDGTLWNDLPFLATDMPDFWINNCAPMLGTQRLNFATFLARLASTRVSKDRICQIALVLFRSTFEDRRELRYSEEPDDEQKSRKIDHFDIAHLSPAAYAWFKEAGYNLIQLSDVCWNDCPSTIGQGGQWFIESELGKRSPTGFTPWRWMYWLKRLHGIRLEAKEINEKRLEQYATDATELMVMIATLEF
ncbi:hypothetical protein BM1_01812 [Bipolaris maydis]|nr:hypothetical protein BM1_01812 [Bipolaris maydis]